MRQAAAARGQNTSARCPRRWQHRRALHSSSVGNWRPPQGCRCLDGNTRAIGVKVCIVEAKVYVKEKVYVKDY